MDKYVHLGVLLGTSVDTTEVYEAALDKFHDRMSTYLPLKSRFSMSSRVKIANTYLLPIFYYLGRFYLKSAYVDKEIDEGLTKWIITANNTNLPRLRAPTHQAGLSCPLVDHRAANVATLLDHKPTPPDPASDTVGVYSLHMRDHWARATVLFIDREVVGRNPEY